MTDITPEMVEAACWEIGIIGGDRLWMRRALTAALAVREITHVWVPVDVFRELVSQNDIPSLDDVIVPMLSAGGKRDDRCPRCDSPDPKRHPAVQFEGEVQICPHPWHHGGKRDE